MATATKKTAAAKKTSVKKSNTKVIEFEFEKDTKNARRFAEVTEGEFAEPLIGSLYVKKSALADLNGGSLPETVTVTLSV